MTFWHSACDRSTRTAAGEHRFRPAVERILTLDFLDRSENLILVGADGLGKTPRAAAPRCDLETGEERAAGRILAIARD